MVGEPAPADPSPSPQPAKRRGAGRNLPMAIATGLVMVGIAFGALFLEPLLFVTLVFLLVIGGLVELVRVLRARDFRPAQPVLYVVAAVLMFGAWRAGTAALSLGILLALIGSFAWYLADRSRAAVTTNVAITVFACLYLPFTAAHLVLVVRETDHYIGAVFG
jgi:phosphatidate cytidylyltransferase